MDTDTEWVDDEFLPPLVRAKIFALKTCRNRCIAHGQDDDALEVAKPVLKMFATILQNGGSFSADAEDEYVLLSLICQSISHDITSPKIKSRLRLQAAVSSLHLAGVKALAVEVQANFISLAITIQVGYVPPS